WGVPDPSAFITKSAGPSSRRLMKTILLPSGDQFGVHGEDPDGPAASAAGECDPLAIGGPHRPTVDPVDRREEPHLGAVGVHDVKLVDSVGITQEYDLAEYEDLRSGARPARRHSDSRTALAPYAGHAPGRIHGSHDRVRVVHVTEMSAISTPFESAATTVSCTDSPSAIVSFSAESVSDATTGLTRTATSSESDAADAWIRPVPAPFETTRPSESTVATVVSMLDHV